MQTKRIIALHTLTEHVACLHSLTRFAKN